MNIAILTLVPIYNVEKYLERCLQSIYDQTFYDIEIIRENNLKLNILRFSRIIKQLVKEG